MSQEFMRGSFKRLGVRPAKHAQTNELFVEFLPCQPQEAMYAHQSVFLQLAYKC